MKRLFYRVFQWWFRRSPFEGALDPKVVKRILILRYDAIGDMIVTIPMIDYLRDLCPQAHIDVVTSPSNSQIVEHESAIHNRYVFDRTFVGFLRLFREMRQRDYDLVFSLVINKTTLAGLLSNVLGGRASVIVSFEHPERRKLYQTWFNVQVPYERGKDIMTLMQLHLVESVLGARVDASKYPLRLSLMSAHHEFAKQSISWMTGRRVVLNISAGNAYRMWSEPRNVELIRHLMYQQEPHTVAIIGYGPAGATLANLLGPYGLSVLVLEREAEIYPLPRAIHFDGDPERCRISRRAGQNRLIKQLIDGDIVNKRGVIAADRTLEYECMRAKIGRCEWRCRISYVTRSRG